MAQEKIITKYGNVITKEWLYNQYIIQEKSSAQIGKILNRTGATVLLYLKTVGISVRSKSEAKKGKLNPGYGKHEKRKKRTPEQIEHMKTYLPRGENHFRYKKPEERIEPINNQIRNCQKSKEWKFSVLKRDNFLCVFCGSKTNLHVDHIFPFCKIKEQYGIDSLEKALLCDDLWDINNGRVLCKKCHEETNTWGFKAKNTK